MLLHSAGFATSALNITARSRKKPTVTQLYGFSRSTAAQGFLWSLECPNCTQPCPTFQKSPGFLDRETAAGFMEGASKVQEIRAELHNCASILIAFCNAKECAIALDAPWRAPGNAGSLTRKLHVDKWTNKITTALKVGSHP